MWGYVELSHFNQQCMFEFLVLCDCTSFTVMKNINIWVKLMKLKTTSSYCSMHLHVQVSLRGEAFPTFCMKWRPLVTKWCSQTSCLLWQFCPFIFTIISSMGNKKQHVNGNIAKLCQTLHSYATEKNQKWRLRDVKMMKEKMRAMSVKELH